MYRVCVIYFFISLLSQVRVESVVPNIIAHGKEETRVTCAKKYRGCVSMDAKGAMGPTNFEKSVFGTHEI